MGRDRCGLLPRLGRRVESGPRIGHWTAQKLGMGFHNETMTAIGLVHDETILAGVIYENWNRRSIMAHIVVEGRLTRDFVHAVFHYPFEICGVEKVICPVAHSNTRSSGLAEHMGFIPEARLADCSPDGDVVLYTLRRRDCRFLRDWTRGQKSSDAASAA